MASSSLQGFEVSFAKTDFDLCVLCQTKKGGLSGKDVGSLELRELIFSCGRASTRRIINIHSLVDSLPTHLPGILLPVHALTGGDFTSKISTKTNAIKVACTEKGYFLNSFANHNLSKEVLSNAELFLIHCIKGNTDYRTFNQLRHSVYHRKCNKLGLGKFPCTSGTLELHIQRAFYQVSECVSARLYRRNPLNPLEFGFI